MRRRSLFLAGAAALAPATALALPHAPAAANPDAALIAACQAFTALEQAYFAAHDAPDAPEDDDAMLAAVAPVVAQWHEVLDEMERLHATTAAGIAARAHALALHAASDCVSFDYPGTLTERMLRYLLRDAALLSAEVRT